VDSNADLVQSKVLLDLLFGGLLEVERKINPHIFRGDPKISFNGLFLRAFLEMHLGILGFFYKR
jgi:hypothetical protein